MSHQLEEGGADRVDPEIAELASLGLLARVVLDEVASPLSGILTCVRALVGGDDEDRRRVYAAAAEEGLDRVWQSLSALRRPVHTARAVEAVDAIAVARRTHQQTVAAASRRAVTVKLVTPGSERRIRAEPGRAERALLQLLALWIDQAAEGSGLRLSVEQEDGLVGFRVRVDDLRRPPSPFGTRNARVSLAVIRDLVEWDGGHLEDKHYPVWGMALRWPDAVPAGAAPERARPGSLEAAG